MVPPHSRRSVLAGASALSLSFLAGCQTSSAPTNGESGDSTTRTDDSQSSLGLAYSESQNAPYPSEQEVHSGWVHIVSDGESADLTFDVRLCSSLGDVEPSLENPVGDEYVLRFTVDTGRGETVRDEASIDESACQSVTRLVGGANVPSEWGTLVVAVNDIEVQSIERSGTFPELRPLPDPVQLA